MTSEDQAILWRNSSLEHVDAPPLSQHLAVDLLVVGGGFTGCAAALEAARRGASVCVLEAEAIAHGGSGRNVGLVNAGLWLPPDEVTEKMGLEAGRRLIQILGDGPQRVFSIIEAEGIACDAVRNGTLHLAHSRAAVGELQERHRQGVLYGAPLKLCDETETARRTGTPAYFGSLWDARAGTVQPLSYCRGLARAARASGAAIHARTAVASLRYRDGQWMAVANGHTVRAQAVLLATNAYQRQFDGPFAPQFTPVSYCQFATEPLPERQRETILSGGEGCWDTAMVMSSFRTDKAGRLIVGGVGNSDGPGSRIHHAWARRKLASLFPALQGTGFSHAWRGRIAMTKDHIPKVVAFGPNAYACFGYSGRGIAPGTVFGTSAATALLTGDAAGLPVEPIGSYAEQFTVAKAAYYETGAILTHAVRS
ncbi:MAG: FAD-binding oxidoreductase [Bosea sp.]|uniref:NAD(P)/FAD-dependent oxidoreductase n=1 Tax=Bosea sp. (in: a-proteobacteria) TaxID=1871050 RepID=UPI001AC7C72F|nr:FAD-binding oxidoreductase [Bosea sp. (in: a-proteobacteria)]MBN9467173.1 FAD-binding oxidoreductase [Bosea sp. (in: a-proteobacteria)]